MKTQNLTIERNQEKKLIQLLNQKLVQLKIVMKTILKNLEGFSVGAGYALRH